MKRTLMSFIMRFNRNGEKCFGGRLEGKEPVSTEKHYFIEQTDDGRYAVRAKGQRASAIVNTQREAVELVKQLNPNDRPDVERVRNTKKGGRDQWRSGK
jgi:hypothetical protein